MGSDESDDFLWNTFVKTDTRYYENIGYRCTDFTTWNSKSRFGDSVRIQLMLTKHYEKIQHDKKEFREEACWKRKIKICRLLSWGCCFLKLAIVNVLHLIFQGTEIYLEKSVSPIASRWLKCRKHPSAKIRKVDVNTKVKDDLILKKIMRADSWTPCFVPVHTRDFFDTWFLRIVPNFFTRLRTVGKCIMNGLMAPFRQPPLLVIVGKIASPKPLLNYCR